MQRERRAKNQHRLYRQKLDGCPDTTPPQIVLENLTKMVDNLHDHPEGLDPLEQCFEHGFLIGEVGVRLFRGLSTAGIVLHAQRLIIHIHMNLLPEPQSKVMIAVPSR